MGAGVFVAPSSNFFFQYYTTPNIRYKTNNKYIYLYAVLGYYEKYWSKEKNTRNNLTGKKNKGPKSSQPFYTNLELCLYIWKNLRNSVLFFVPLIPLVCVCVWQIQWSIKIVYNTYIAGVQKCTKPKIGMRKKLNFSNAALLLFAHQFSACGPQTCRIILYCIPDSFSIMLFDWLEWYYVYT